jgi:cyclophilin family peptidyl-prolyl cis-trans isomerase
MANADPNTNGSQFFITHIATDWLNRKHTVLRPSQDVVNAIRQGDDLISVTISEEPKNWNWVLNFSFRGSR